MKMSSILVSDAAVSGKFPSTPKAVRTKPEDIHPSGSSSDDEDDLSSASSLVEKEFEDLNGKFNTQAIVSEICMRHHSTCFQWFLKGDFVEAARVSVDACRVRI